MCFKQDHFAVNDFCSILFIAARNLTYGAPDNSDLSVVKGVLKMLDMKNILQHLQRLVCDATFMFKPQPQLGVWGI